ncbi:MAG: mechanosensitive ion channel family protein [Pseudomonadota bacterium]
MTRWWCARGFGALALVLWVAPVAVADHHGTGDVETPAKVEQFLELLSEPEVELWLRQRAEPQEGPVDAVEAHADMPMSSTFDSLRQRIRVLARVAPELPTLPARVRDAWVGNLSRTEILRGAIYLLIFLFVGASFEWLYRQFTDGARTRLSLAVMPTLNARVVAASKRAALMIGGQAAFAVGALGAYLLFDWQQAMAELVLTTLAVVLTTRVLSTLSRYVLAPNSPRLRLLNLTTAFAKVNHRWNVGAVASSLTCIAGANLSALALQRSGSPDSDAAALAVTALAGAVCAAVVIGATWHTYTGYRAAKGITTPTSYAWPVYVTVLTLFTYVLWLIGAPRFAGTVVVVGLVPLVLSLAGVTINDLFNQAERTHLARQAEAANAAADGESDADAREHDAALRQRDFGNYRPVAHRLLRFILVAGALLLLLWVWGSDFYSMSRDSSFGGMVFGIVIDVIAAALLADLVWVWAKTAIDRRLADYEPPTDGRAPGPEARMATLLPLLRSVLMITLLIMVGLTVLSSLGVNIAPLIAGAGVLGVAVGFGAQALVRDIVSGIFFLIDDAFRIGEYIEIENLRGTVESMSIRSLRVRHHRGAVHTIPFGELKSLTNHSRDWVIMKLEFRVPFETDLKLVKKLIKQVGAELKANEDYGDSIIQTLKSQGVRRMEEFNMVIGVKFMARPGEQWVIRRDAYMKVRDIFDKNGLTFAERNVKVEVLGADAKNPAVQEAAAAAVHEATENRLPPAPIPDEP